MPRPDHLTTTQIGQRVEAAAARLLRREGLALVSRNFRCKMGEIDLVMTDRSILTFVEVRYRRNTRYGRGVDTVDYRKRTRIINAAHQFLRQHPAFDGFRVRFDVVSATGELTDLQLDWIRDAFQLD